MSTASNNRIISARPRTDVRLENGDFLSQRPTTSIGTHSSWNRNSLSSAALKGLEPASLVPGRKQRQRAKTACVTSQHYRPIPKRALYADEIDTLIRTLDDKNSSIAEIDCLANFQTLAQTIDLRRTPVDSQALFALQRRENQIVQKNACRDTRYLSLLNILEPFRLPSIDLVQAAESRTDHRTVIVDYSLTT